VNRRLPIRFWLQAGFATCTGVLLVLTLAVPRWIEVLFEAEPDAGSGSTEWLAVAALAVATAVAAGLGVRTWQVARKQA
jgi:hypothetical protein